MADAVRDKSLGAPQTRFAIKSENRVSFSHAVVVDSSS